ncbi:MAG: toll/interleukin-1 receptor domain-containing protein [Anaerolineales bacterium]|nr:toll/interleukin-1 receptor domain-containing protein [Anaerolineales bacterium]
MTGEWESDEFIDEIVFVTRGKHKGRIGYCDESYSRTWCIVYFGHMLTALRMDYNISYKSLRIANVNDLLNRRTKIDRLLILNEILDEKRVTLLEELMLIKDILNEKAIRAKFYQAGEQKKVFVSHSSQDKAFATQLAFDLSNAGYHPWLDNWEIFAGDSIPNKIAVGIKDCDFVLVILSKNSVNSHWVEREWEAKYWDEVQSGEIKVIPVLLNECAIPQLLKTKKYANFTWNYANGLDEILLALNRTRS